MLRYISRRLVQTVVVFLLICFFSYMILFLIPGDPVYAMYGANITQEQYQMYYEKLELDQPLVSRFLNWLIRFLHGDFGYSTKYHIEVTQLLAARLPVTMQLGILSIFVTAGFGIVFGVIAAVKRGKWMDSVITVFANVGSTVPLFWIGVLGVYIFSIKLGWLPASGYVSPFEDFGLNAKQVLMPVIALAFCQVATITRLTRSNMLEVIHEDYVKTARSKGLSEKRIVMEHVIPNAISPVIIMLGMLFRIVVSGSIAIEKIFNIPGMGQLMIYSITSKDINPLQACIVVVSAVTLLVNLLVDIISAMMDPRIRLQ